MQPPGPGALLVIITPDSPSSGDLQVTRGSLHLEGIAVFGDPAPNGRSMLGETDLQLVGNPTTFRFDMIPQGLYSRVRFGAESLTLEGSWRGHELRVAFELQEGGSIIDLRSASGVDVQPGQDGTLPITERTSAWFSNDLLDAAALDGDGRILIDYSHNVSLLDDIAQRVVPSFALSTALQ